VPLVRQQHQPGGCAMALQGAKHALALQREGACTTATAATAACTHAWGIHSRGGSSPLLWHSQPRWGLGGACTRCNDGQLMWSRCPCSQLRIRLCVYRGGGGHGSNPHMSAEHTPQQPTLCTLLL
jgi:hypothetical protein